MPHPIPKGLNICIICRCKRIERAIFHDVPIYIFCLSLSSAVARIRCIKAWTSDLALCISSALCACPRQELHSRGQHTPQRTSRHHSLTSTGCLQHFFLSWFIVKRQPRVRVGKKLFALRLCFSCFLPLSLTYLGCNDLCRSDQEETLGPCGQEGFCLSGELPG